jgi:hypothetical protein
MEYPRKLTASIECAFRFRSEIFVAFASVSGLKPSPLRSERLRAVIKKAVATYSHHCFAFSIIGFVVLCMSRVKMNVLRTPLTYIHTSTAYKLCSLSLLGVSTPIEGIARLMFDCTALADEILPLSELFAKVTRS